MADRSVENTTRSFTTVVVDAGHGGKDNGAYRRFGGAEKIATLDVARRLVVYLKRPGGQSQFSTVLAAQASDVEGRFSALHAWIIENIASDLRVETLAEKAGMTPRTFARTYTSRTGMTPASGVEALRVETARLLLESRQVGGVVEVAKRAGFGDDERMRRAFLRHLGVSPTEYRNRFSGG